MLQTHAPAFPRDRLLALLVLCAATLMTVLDETVVSVALPSIQRDLGFAPAGLSWVVNGYLVAFGGLLLLAGRIGDLVGRRKVFLAGLWLFVVASMLCGTAPSAEWLVGGRFLQGVGGALAASVALGMVVALFDEPALQARAIGIYAFTASIGASLGLFLGGVITDLASWRWVFFVNLPIGLVTVFAGRRLLADAPGSGLRGGADAFGAATLVSGLMLGLVAIVDESRRWLGVPAALLLVLFAVRQATARTPLLPVHVLRVREVVGANAVFALLVGAMFGFQFMITLYFQRVLGYSPSQSGIGVFPVAAGIATVSLVVYPRLARRWDPRLIVIPGLLSIAVGLALMTRAPVDARYVVDVLPSIVLFGVGGGLTIPSAMTIAMAKVDPASAGTASGLLNTSQQAGGAVGLAVLASLAAGRTSSIAGDADPTAQALVAGFHVAWGVGAAMVAVAVALAALTLLRRSEKVQCGS